VSPATTPTVAALNRAAEAIWLTSSPQWPTLSVEVLPSVGSTNTELMARGRRGETAPCVLMAAQQTAGRGRLGRSWLAEEGRCLTLSIGVPLALDATPGGGSALSLVVGVCAAQAMQALIGANTAGLGLKWPNDLLWRGRKLGGILIEATPAPQLAPGERWVVIGLGLNVLPPQQALAWPQAALADAFGPHEAAHLPDLGDLAQAVVPVLLAALPTFVQAGFSPWRQAFERLDVLAGQDVVLRSAASAWPQQGQTGVAQGVDGSGALLVHTSQGLVTCTSGEVSVRSAALPDLPGLPTAPP
jgi:BirA family biotin operon repressor/biotin-[acetyl-CoA-carboxylase] ligase